MFMADKLFRFQNRNEEAFVVPQEQGATEDDNYFGSIGDATMKHILGLSHADRQLWEDLICMRDGSIFYKVPSYDTNDRDPMSLAGRDLNKHITEVERKVGNKLDESGRNAITEIFEEEEKRREESEDCYDKADCIPYHLMEQFPGMEKHIDIPTTPKDRFIYMGNTREPFLDHFPEGHPDSNVITRYIRMLDRTDKDSDYYDWVCEQLECEECTPYVRKYLTDLVLKIQQEEEDPTTCVEVALDAIDTCWKTEFKNNFARMASKDGLLQLLIYQEEKWEQESEDGFNVYSSIKQFGSMLFKNHQKEMTYSNWARYRKIRDKYAPKVIARGFDINRCGIRELEQALNTDRSGAQKVWFSRPFESLAQACNKNVIQSKSFADCRKSEEIISLIEKVADHAENKLDLSFLVNIGKRLISAQTNKTIELQAQSWKLIWTYYRIRRDDVTRRLNDPRKED